MSFFPNQKPDSIALYTEAESWSYDKFQAASEKIAASIGRRTLIFILCRNIPMSIAAYVGCLNHGIVPSMIDGEIERELLAQLVETYRPSCLWLPEARSREVSGYERKLSIENYVLLVDQTPLPFVLHDDLALLMTTSGSTGSPKFVRLSYENIRANTESIIEYLGISEHERAITNLPMHYVYGLSIINTHLYVGASLVVTEKTLFQKEFWQLFREKKVTSLSGVPYTFEMLERLRFFRMKLPSLRTITQAGGKLDPELHQKFARYAEEQGKRFFVMYGASEATARMGYLPADESLRKCGRMGIAIPGGSFELKDDQGNVIYDTNCMGELVYHGANVMMGYSEDRADLIKGDVMQGTLFTGDLAKRDEEGFYTIVGRKKRFLKMFGKRTNLEEVEHILRQNFGIADVACSGEDDHLYVFLVDGSIEKEVIPYLSAKLGLHASGFKVRLLEEIPKNASGKILYRELMQYCS